jgi:hypothetical protein
VALLLFTFKMAYGLFTTPPSVVIGLEPNKPVDPSSAAAHLFAAVMKVGLLVVMAVVSGLVANRGVHLYAESRAHHMDREA